MALSKQQTALEIAKMVPLLSPHSLLVFAFSPQIFLCFIIGIHPPARGSMLCPVRTRHYLQNGFNAITSRFDA